MRRRRLDFGEAKLKESSRKINFKDLKFAQGHASERHDEVKQTSDDKAAAKFALGRLNKKVMVRRAIHSN